ncbi:Nce101p NDAI_0I00300 [Naumovozyma dairenensis CBS 421]|uniref:Non-classical export protein 1 n=1 Tax=Naumovozyma dairenensis (strain ATCC 10597 / BCRC 20456 / CBS 421 / NBRC 0211 / NRRL Y-12639) TaxID=1071378 RepID=G0WFN8_NAUDC|nr:hypothetical protein NDAI_0I00300 [Naumovozyma dairenensis CBS 421]CCD26599.1 hypothetical protein NDAI_0I00300 [Naumovozyma dairenensis CBS 421]
MTQMYLLGKYLDPTLAVAVGLASYYFYERRMSSTSTSASGRPTLLTLLKSRYNKGQ